MFDIVCINLKKDTTKWNDIQKESQKLKLNITRYDAVNGNEYIKKNGKNNLKKIMTYKILKFLSNGAIGCFLSHYSLWHKIINENLEHLLIIEDDIYFLDNADQQLRKIYNNLPEDFDIIFLNCGGICGSKCTNMFGINMCENVNELYNIPKYSLGSYAYVISNNGAKKMLRSMFPLDIEFDVKIGYLINNKLINGYSLNDSIVEHHKKEFSNITNMRKQLLNKIGMHWFNSPIFIVYGYHIDVYTLTIIFMACIFGFKYTKNSLCFLIILLFMNWIDFLVGNIPQDRINVIYNFIDTVVPVVIFLYIKNSLLCKCELDSVN
jgi:glycosyl transferase family 25